jgi:putative phosphoesterase
VISDTHDLLRPEALAALKASDLILHAGDICGPEVLEVLERIAPVFAVRGNNDRGSWARALPLFRTLDISGYRIHVLHDLKELDVDPRAEGFHAVVSGHSHQPGAHRRNGVLFLNPGSAGPRRFKLPVAVARLHLGARGLRARIVEVALRGSRSFRTE